MADRGETWLVSYSSRRLHPWTTGLAARPNPLNHYLPFVAMARVERWSVRKTLLPGHTP